MQENVPQEVLLNMCRYEMHPGRCVYLLQSLRAIIYEGQADDLQSLTRRLKDVMAYIEEDAGLSTQERVRERRTVKHWGLDRIDQRYLPLDSMFESPERGGEQCAGYDAAFQEALGASPQSTGIILLNSL
jgi:hypothetical protein